MAPSVHTIRLRGPWEAEILAENAKADAKTAWRRIVVPCEFSAVVGDANTSVRLRRNFQRPSGLSADSRVLLAISPFTEDDSLRLNGERLQPLDTGSRAVFEVGPLLQTRNEIELTLAPQDGNANGPRGENGPWPLDEAGEVVLEIWEP